MKKWTPRDRWIALREGREIDRPPWALWRHLPQHDFQSGFARAQLYEWLRGRYDLGKINLRSTFCLRDFGVKDEWAGDPWGRPRFTRRPVQHPDDWYQLADPDVGKGVLGWSRDCVEELLRATPDDLPVLVPVFSPRSQAIELAGAETWRKHCREDAAAVLHGLEKITASTRRWMESFSNRRLDGWFYVVKEAEWEDLPARSAHAGDQANRMLLHAHGRELDLVHLHGRARGFSGYASYPAAIFHWDSFLSGYCVAEGASIFNGIVAGGLDWNPDTVVSPETAAMLVESCFGKNMPPKRWMPAPGCVIPCETPWPWIDAIYESMRTFPRSLRPMPG
jgi:uroporphyrinogen decarboxylase